MTLIIHFIYTQQRIVIVQIIFSTKTIKYSKKYSLNQGDAPKSFDTILPKT